MTNITQTPAYRVAFSMYVALGGDKTRIFDSVEAIYAEIDKFYGKGSRITTEALTLEITENKAELYNDDAITGYKPVSISVNVPQKYTDEQVEDLKDTARDEGYTSGYDKGIVDGYVQGETAGYSDGYSEGLEDGAEDQKALLEDITIRDNGVYEKEDGYKKVTVEVPIPEIPTFETETLSVELTENGTYNYTPTADGYSKVSVTVEVAGSGGGDGGFDWSNSGYTDEQIALCNSYIKDDIDYIQNIISTVNNATTTNMQTVLRNDANIVFLPPLNIAKNATNIKDMFASCYSLKYVPRLQIPYGVNTYSSSGLFGYCRSLKRVDNLNIPNATTLRRAFYNCNNLEHVYITNTSNVTDMQEMFYMNYNVPSKLTVAPEMDMSKVTTTYNMFTNCTALTTVPQYNTSKVTDMRYMFSNCPSLKNGAELDTSSVTNMGSMYADCKALTTVPQYNTSKLTAVNNMFQNCQNLISLPEFDFSSLTTLISFFSGKSSPSFHYLTTMGGFKNLGMQASFTGATDNYFLYQCPNLTKESLLNILNKLYDRAAAGYSIAKLKMHSNHLALLSDDEKAIATTKGWNLTT